MDNMNIQVVQELSGRYLKIAVEKKAGDFGEEVLRYNDMDGILRPQIRQIDNMPQYLYEIGDRISLSELFKKGQLVAKDLKGLIYQLVQRVEMVSEYLLEGQDLVLISDYMFFDQRDKKLYVAYLDGYGCDVGEGISKLLETCIDYMNHHDKELVFLVYGLHKVSKGEHFCLKHLTDFIGQKGMDSQRREERPTIKPREEKSRTCTDQVLQPADSKQQRASHNYIRVAIYVAMGIAVFAAAFCSGVLSEPASGEPDWMKAAILALVIVILEGYVIGKERTKHNLTRMQPQGENWDDKTVVLADSLSDETVVLSGTTSQTQYVNFIPEDWQREEIKVRKSPFFIGKNVERADGIIKEGEISRVHAKVVMEEDGVFVIDQESTNGTYVNGIQLLPWERRKIHKDDVIGFSSIYYKVEMDL